MVRTFGQQRNSSDGVLASIRRQSVINAAKLEIQRARNPCDKAVQRPMAFPPTRKRLLQPTHSSIFESSEDERPAVLHQARIRDMHVDPFDWNRQADEHGGALKTAQVKPPPLCPTEEAPKRAVKRVPPPSQDTKAYVSTTYQIVRGGRRHLIPTQQPEKPARPQRKPLAASTAPILAANGSTHSGTTAGVGPTRRVPALANSSARMGEVFAGPPSSPPKGFSYRPIWHTQDTPRFISPYAGLPRVLSPWEKLQKPRTESKKIPREKGCASSAVAKQGRRPSLFRVRAPFHTATPRGPPSRCLPVQAPYATSK
jgi:hypothetical protein